MCMLGWRGISVCDLCDAGIESVPLECRMEGSVEHSYSLHQPEHARDALINMA